MLLKLKWITEDNFYLAQYGWKLGALISSNTYTYYNYTQNIQNLRTLVHSLVLVHIYIEIRS